MPVPLPPPPPPPPPPLPSGGPPPPPPLASSEIPKLQKEEQKARNALLADIQQGTRLRKVTQINDRSAPQIEKPKGANRDGVPSAINKGGPQQPLGGSQQPLGGLFAGGFPVLRPAGQRDMSAGRPGQLPGARAAAPRTPAPPSSGAVKGSSVPSHAAEGPRAAVPPDPPGTPRAAAGPGRPSLPAPPPPPPASSKPSLTFPPPPPLPPPAERPPKGVSPGAAPPPPPPPPQADKPTKFQAGAVHSPPTPPPPPPPLPLVPPCGFSSRTPDFSAAAVSSPPEGRDCPLPTPPPPPPPPPPAPHTHPLTSNRLSFPPSPAELPPPLPPKSPHLLSQFHKPSSIQSMPLPPTPGLPQPTAVVETRKKRPGRGAGAGAGKLVTPPQPPARSPTTELTSKSGVSAWAAAHDPYPSLKNGNMHIIDDFESKFTFHSVEDFPPPDEFKPFQKIYPSKIARVLATAQLC